MRAPQTTSADPRPPGTRLTSPTICPRKKVVIEAEVLTPSTWLETAMWKTIHATSQSTTPTAASPNATLRRARGGSSLHKTSARAASAATAAPSAAARTSRATGPAAHDGSGSSTDAHQTQSPVVKAARIDTRARRALAVETPRGPYG